MVGTVNVSVVRMKKKEENIVPSEALGILPVGLTTVTRSRSSVTIYGVVFIRNEYFKRARRVLYGRRWN